MDKQPLISILCAIRNDERFIRETLDTVVAQTYPNWELIVMDAASTDSTPDIVKGYAEKYPNIIFRSEPDQGQWDGLEKALALSSGEYITLLCGQDGYLDKNWFQKCMDTFRDHSEVSLVWGIPFNMSEDGELLGPGYAYARFLKDERFGSRTKPLSSLKARIDWTRPNALNRLSRIVRKLTLKRVFAILRSFRKESLPQKEDWFFFWLKDKLPFPEGNMLIRRDVYVRNTVRFPKETMTNRALLDLCYEFNVNGYLSYGLPVAASFGRYHVGGQPLIEFDDMVISNYRKKISKLSEDITLKDKMQFRDGNGAVISERSTK